jgi:hypothetical protein
MLCCCVRYLLLYLCFVCVFIFVGYSCVVVVGMFSLFIYMLLLIKFLSVLVYRVLLDRRAAARASGLSASTVLPRTRKSMLRANGWRCAPKTWELQPLSGI